MKGGGIVLGSFAVLVILLIAVGVFAVPIAGRWGSNEFTPSCPTESRYGPPRAPGVSPLVGAATPTDEDWLEGLARFERNARTEVQLFMWYEAFGRDEFDPTMPSVVSGRGALPVITWEPWMPEAGTEQPRYRLERIIDGDFDEYVRRWAGAVREWGGPLVLRFAHEMNGAWYPWSESTNGNRPGEYVAAWRHVHDIFAEAHADNVIWVWSPNVAVPGSRPVADLYPGDAYVDWVGVDGYNWGISQRSGRWQSFEELASETIGDVRAVSCGKPLIISEVASGEDGGDKAEWISGFFDYIAAQPDLIGFVWFDYDKEADWRISSSERSRDAFVAGLARFRKEFGTTR
jgi:beta-mannanase